jgi:hypothetical protein
MLSIRINDADFLELPTDTAINLTLINPAFDAQGIARTYSFPLRIPLTPANRVTLDHQHRLDTRIRKKYIPQDIILDGLPFESGRALVEEHTESLSEITFQNEDLTRIDALSDINIRDLLGIIEIPQTETTSYVLTGEGGPNFLITINGVLYSAGGLGVPRADALSDLADAINVDYPGVASYNVPSDEFRLITTEETFVISFANTDFSLVSEQTLSDAREKNLQAYITAAAASGTTPVAFPVVYAPNFYRRNFRYRFYLNHRIDGNYLTNGYGAEFGWETTYVPFVRLRYILDLIAAELGIEEIVFDLPTAQAAELNSLLIYNNVSLDQLRLETSVIFGEKEKNGFKTSITLADHVPDYSAAELLDRIKGYFNLNLRFERNRLLLRPNLRQAASVAKDWTSITNPAYQRTTTEGGGVVLTFDKDTSTDWAPTHDDVIIGDGSNTYTLPAKPLHDRTLPLFEESNEGWKVAAIEGQTGTSEPLDLETENLTLRLFFDRGQQENETGKLYWMGSTETTDYAAASIGTISLGLSPTDGIYQTFWRGWTQLLFSPTITRIAALSLAQLLDLRKWVNTKIYIHHPEGETTAIVERIQIKITTRGMSQAKLEYRKFEP